MIKKIFGLITIVAICAAIVTGCNDIRFDNSTNKNDLITEKYSITQIEKLKCSMNSENITFSKFKKDFNAQCVRKTHQGYYVVLLLEDDKNAFIFFDEENNLVSAIVTNEFKSKKEFQTQVLFQMSEKEVIKFDPNTIFMPVSAVEITAHIVKEGVFVVKYSRFSGNEMLDEPIVDSITFIENEQIPTSEDWLVRNEIPFIFEFDKLSE